MHDGTRYDFTSGNLKFSPQVYFPYNTHMHTHRHTQKDRLAQCLPWESSSFTSIMDSQLPSLWPSAAYFMERGVFYELMCPVDMPLKAVACPLHPVQGWREHANTNLVSLPVCVCVCGATQPLPEPHHASLPCNISFRYRAGSNTASHSLESVSPK